MESNVKKLLLLLFFLPNLALSETIATCENPQGYAYFPFSGNAPEADSGWFTDGFTGGVYRLTQDDNGNFDVIFTGKGGQFISAIQDGGSVAPFSYDENQISILVLYMGSVVETFSFIKNNEGNNELILTQTKTKIFPKAASYRAKCSQLDLYKINI
jgi:hypothetical protein